MELVGYFKAAQAALDRDLWMRLGLPMSRDAVGTHHITELTRVLRDQALENGVGLRRSRLSYILLALLNSGYLRPGIEYDDIRSIFSAYVVSRIRHNGIAITEKSLNELQHLLYSQD